MDKIFRHIPLRSGRGLSQLSHDARRNISAFVDALLTAETAPIHGFEESKVFEGCMPVESMARRGRMVVGFRSHEARRPAGTPERARKPFAVVQLRQDNAAGTLYNLVGFQTRLKFPEQKRVFGMIPGLENASYARYGVMHRNTFLHSPGFLNAHFEMIARPQCYFRRTDDRCGGLCGERRQRIAGGTVPGQ